MSRFNWRRARNPVPPRFQKSMRVRYRGRQATVLRARSTGQTWVYDIAVGMRLVVEVAEGDLEPLPRTWKGLPDD